MNKLDELLVQASRLSSECGWSSQATWFDEMRESLKDAQHDPPVFLAILDELDRALAGMGSFSDLPLQPPLDRMTVQGARDRQWKLVAALGDLIAELKAKRCDASTEWGEATLGPNSGRQATCFSSRRPHFGCRNRIVRRTARTRARCRWCRGAEAVVHDPSAVRVPDRAAGADRVRSRGVRVRMPLVAPRTARFKETAA